MIFCDLFGIATGLGKDLKKLNKTGIESIATEFLEFQNILDGLAGKESPMT